MSEKSRLEFGLDWSEKLIVISGLVLACGCIGEYLEENDKVKLLPRFLRWSKVSFVLMVTISLVCEFLADTGVYLFSSKLQILEGATIEALDKKATEAGRKASDAVNDSEEAITKAGKANETSRSSSKTSMDALQTARSARREADTFENDIASAKKLAGDAESHLKDALAQAETAATLAKGYSAQIVDARKDAAEAKSLVADIRQLSEEARKRTGDVAEMVSKLKSTRSLVDKESLVTALSRFKDTEYGFDAVNGDTDSTDMLAEIERILSRSGWKRIDQPGGLNAINIPVDDRRIPVAQLPRRGIQLSTQSNMALSLLQVFLSTHPERLPHHIAAAVSLRLGLYTAILPHEENPPDPVIINSGDSTVLLISVGSKRP